MLKLIKSQTKLSGSSLVGTSTTRDRVENDFYATPYESTRALLDNFQFKGKFLEPCVGQGHIADVIKEYYTEPVEGIDIVDRGYENTLVADFLEHKFDSKFNSIITNPPYSLALEFAEKSLSILNKKGQLAMFLKIQFLEGVKRKEFFEKFPPKYVAVFSKRQNPLHNGSATDEKGKPWSSTMCFAWFIWEEGHKEEPIIKWL